MRIAIFLFLLTVAAAAQSIDSIRPRCAGPDNKVLITGVDFGREPTVTIGDTKVTILRRDATRLLVRIPADAPAGRAVIDVDGATDSIDVLAKGAPVIRRLSSNFATAKQIVVVVGRHLRNARVVFINARGTEVARAALRGRHHVAFFRVPTDIATGEYTLEFRNDKGDSGACSPSLAIVEAGDPTIKSMTPESAHPGRFVLCKGTDLGPLGLCTVSWTDESNNVLRTRGFANGYGRVRTRVPVRATPGAKYSVVIKFRGGATTATGGRFFYTVGAPVGPVITKLRSDEGPAGSRIGIFGTGFFSGLGAMLAERKLPVVNFTRDRVTTQARVLSARPGFGDRNDLLIVRVPPDLPNGNYDVTVTVGDTESAAVVFRVMSVELTVSAMFPKVQAADAPVWPVYIQGSGFGTESIAVTWDKDADDLRRPREGKILFHGERVIFVIPPGGRSDRLPKGSYTVRVTTNPGTERAETVIAGTYTVR